MSFAHRNHPPKNSNKVEVSFSNWVMGGSLLSLTTTSSLGSRLSTKDRNSFGKAETDNETVILEKAPGPPTPPKKSSTKKQPAAAPEGDKPKDNKEVCSECKGNEAPATGKCGQDCAACNEECLWERHMHEKYGDMECKTCGRGSTWLKEEFHKGRGEYACEKCTPDCAACGRGPLWIKKKWEKTLARRAKIIQSQDGKKKDSEWMKNKNKDGEKTRDKDKGEKKKDGEKGKGAEKEIVGSEKKDEGEKKDESKNDGGDGSAWKPEQDTKLMEMKAQKKSWGNIMSEVGHNKKECVDRFKHLQMIAHSGGEKKDETATGDSQNSGGGDNDDGLMGGAFDGWGNNDSTTNADNSNTNADNSGWGNNDANINADNSGWGNNDSNTNADNSGNSGWGNNNTNKDTVSGDSDNKQNQSQNKQNGGGKKQKNKNKGNKEGKEDGDSYGKVGHNSQPSAQDNQGWGVPGTSGDNNQSSTQNNFGWGAANSFESSAGGAGATYSWGGGGGGGGGGTGDSWGGGGVTGATDSWGGGGDKPPETAFAKSPNTGHANAFANSGWGGAGGGAGDGWVTIDPDDNASAIAHAAAACNNNSRWGEAKDSWNAADTSKDTAGSSGKYDAWSKPETPANADNPGVTDNWNQTDTVNNGNIGEANDSWNQPENSGHNSGNGAYNSTDTNNNKSGWGMANNISTAGKYDAWNKPETFNNANDPNEFDKSNNGGAFNDSCNNFDNSNNFNSNDVNSNDNSRGGDQPRGRLQATGAWTREDCTLLEWLETKHREHKWAHMQAEFYNWTGRMIPAELIEWKFKADGAA